MTNFYRVTHYWSGEHSTYIVQSHEMPDEATVVDILGIDFEPELGETIEIELEDVTYIEPRKGN